MKPYRSGRAWVPAAVVSVVFTLSLIALQVVFRVAYDDSYAQVDYEDSALEWLFVTSLDFWGTGAFETDSARLVVGNLLAVVVLFVVTFLVAWIALRGAAPGSSALPAFLGGWAATMVAAPVASVTIVLVRFYDQLDENPLGLWLGGALSNSAYGFKWGWVAALLGTLVWLVVRPRPGQVTPPVTEPAGPEPVTASEPEPPA